MLDYRKSDLMDELYKRYLESYELTLETEDVTGALAYKFVLECYTKNLKSDIKILDTEMKYYMQFCKKERKYQVKCENLNFNYIDDAELKEYSFIERLIYKLKRNKYEKLTKKFKKTIQKYRFYIPEDWYIEDLPEEKQESQTPKEIEENTLKPEKQEQDDKNGDVDLSAEEDVAGATKEKMLEDGDQLQITLEDFFSNVEDINEEIKE